MPSTSHAWPHQSGEGLALPWDLLFVDNHGKAVMWLPVILVVRYFMQASGLPPASYVGRSLSDGVELHHPCWQEL